MHLLEVDVSTWRGITVDEEEEVILLQVFKEWEASAKLLDCDLATPPWHRQ
jgi:hypothetical protein